MSLSTNDYLIEPCGFGKDTTPRTLPDIFSASAEKFRDSLAVVGEDTSWTWARWHAESHSLACGLRELGIGVGDVVGVHLPNSWEFLVAHVGIAIAGAVMLPLHMAYGEQELNALLRRAQARALILPSTLRDADGAERGRRLLTDVPSLKQLLLTTDNAKATPDLPEAIPFDALLRVQPGRFVVPVALTPDQPLVLLPSSATTSARPKICIHTHGALLANAWAVARDGAASDDDTIVSASPFTHLFGLLSVHLLLLTGARHALLAEWDPDGLRRLVRRCGATVLFAVPAQLRDLLELAATDSHAQRIRLRNVRTGGAAVPATLVAKITDVLGARTIVQWGMSELGAGTATSPNDPPELAARSIGRPISGGQARIVDSNGGLCAVGEAGELQYRGPYLFRGYLGDPEATQAAITSDGWLRTGDLACRNDDGTLSYRGRTVELINVGGLKFSASEVEGLLSDLTQFTNAAIAARGDDKLGEYPCLIAALRPGARITLAEVRGHLASKGVARYKWPLELIVVDEVPVTPTGKIARGRLAELLAHNTTSATAQRPDSQWAEQIMALPIAERPRVTLDLVQRQFATVIGQPPARGRLPERSFEEAGLGSLGSVQLSVLLSRATGLSLPTTIVFDHPTPKELAHYLLVQVTKDTGQAPATHPQASSHQATRHDVADDPVAIVGIGCRFPGAVSSPEELWRLLAEGRETVGPFPRDRGWDLASIYDPDGGPGHSYVRHGHFLDNATEFDASFFNISPREARVMDPQQRLLLETSWEALEHAGLDPESLRGTDTAVFMGLMASDYAPRVSEDSESFDGHLLTGNASSVASGRISYALGLRGPALTVDTACSSSLVALHLARQALLRSECSLALAGAATVMSTPASFIDFSQQRALSADGRCKAFSARANGAGWAEGAGVVVLERLSHARRRGHAVLAVISGSAVNQDGASNGLTAPNGLAQQEVIRLALADAGLAPHDIAVVEAHGTGTPLGDRIEAGALLAVYGRARAGRGPLWLGSVKSNIGHAQAAAGIAGVIKMVMALRHQTLPRTLHVEQPSPDVGWSNETMSLLAQARPWPRSDSPRRAAVSAFGISGTNAHVIIQDPESRVGAESAISPRKAPPNQRPLPWVLAATSEPALRAQAARLAAALTPSEGIEAADVGYTLVSSRSPSRSSFRHRAVIVSSRPERLLEGLSGLATGVYRDEAVSGASLPDHRPVFVFPGQGSQWPRMAAELLADAPVFADSIAACDHALAPHIDWSVQAVLRAEANQPPLSRVDVAQTSLFAVMVSLAALWRSYGVLPAAVIGHSQGEIAAACVSEALTLDDGARLVALRARAVRALSGRMAAVSLPVDELTPRLTRGGRRLAVAAQNAPGSTVVAGDEAEVDELLRELHAEGIRAQPIDVDYASHCAHVEPAKEQLLRELNDLTAQAAKTRFFSTVESAWLDTIQLTAEYWYHNLRRPVAFASSVTTLLHEGYRTFIEMSPHPVLTHAIQQTAEAADVTALAIGTLRRGDGGLRRFLLSAAEAYVHGVPVDWRAAFTGHPVRHLDLPTYPFQRQRFWLSDKAGEDCAPRRRLQRPAPSPATAGPNSSAPRTKESLLEVVRHHAAAVLGHADAASVGPDHTFLECGMTSLSAVELRSRLSAVLGLSLPSTVAFDHPTPRRLTAHLWRCLTAAARPIPAPRRSGGAVRDEARTTTDVPESIEAIYQLACKAGQGAVAAEALRSISLLRPRFSVAQSRDHMPDAVTLSSGDVLPALVCFPSITPLGGPHEYIRLARRFSGRRDVIVLPQPGFVQGEALPADLTALVNVHSEALTGRGDPSHMLLCGHSSGGWIAHATATRLEELNRPAAGLVLIDTYAFDEDISADRLSLILRATVARQRHLGLREISVTRLTAMGGYLRILSGWQPMPIASPTLLVAAETPLGIGQGHDDGRWRLPHTAATTPGDHFTMLDRYAAHVASAIDSWQPSITTSTQQFQALR